MALTEFETAFAETITAKYVSGRRPPEHLREQVDLTFQIHDQSVILYELRANYRHPDQMIRCEFAKTTYTRKTKRWKIYWMRAKGDWNIYQPTPEVRSLDEFLRIVEEDKHGCFWG